MTEYHKDFFQENPPNTTQALKHYSSFLKEGVAYGTHILSWGNGESKDKTEVSVLLFRQFLDSLDSLFGLIEFGSNAVLGILLRNLLEINLSLHFISESNTEQRALAYKFKQLEEDLIELDKLDITTPRGQLIKSIFENENWIKNPNPKYTSAELKGKREFIKNELENNIFKEVVEESEKFKKAKWYKFFGGADNLEGLSVLLKKRSLYEILYRHWSQATHGKNIRKTFDNLSEDRIAIHPIRQPLDLMWSCRIACNITLNTFAYYVKISNKSKESEYFNWQKEFLKSNDEGLDREYINRPR